MVIVEATFRGMPVGDWATWIAAAIAFASAFIAVWWPWHNRSQASWAVAKMGENGEDGSSAFAGLREWMNANEIKAPDKILEISNDGDGDAFDVEIQGVQCEIKRVERHGDVFVTTSLYSRVKTADSMIVFVYFPKRQAEYYGLRIEWTLRPTRLGRRVYLFTYDGEGAPRPTRHPIRKWGNPFRFQSKLRYRLGRFLTWAGNRLSK